MVFLSKKDGHNNHAILFALLVKPLNEAKIIKFMQNYIILFVHIFLLPHW